jgi:hypothetical protein
MQGFKSSAVRTNTSSSAYLATSHRTEPVPPEPDRLVANVDAALEQQILDLAERQWVAHIHHHRQANDLGRRVEIAERIFHPPKLRGGPDPLKLFCSDNAPSRSCLIPMMKVDPPGM